MNTNDYHLIADIGGTNARFALTEKLSQVPSHALNLVCADYANLTDAVNAYLETVPFAKPSNASFAIATGVTNDALKMTNNKWVFSIEETRIALNLNQLKVINDFTGLALAIPHLTSEHYVQIGEGKIAEKHTKAVIGPGTGLGVSGAIPVNGSWFPLEGEGGHVSYGPLNEREASVIAMMKDTMEHVSAEALVSGSGVKTLYQSLLRIEGKEPKNIKPEQISQMAIEGSCPIATEALSMFCSILGSVAGNLALTIGTRGGVYIGGGIIPKNLEYFIASEFRERFEQHGRFTQYLSEIPTFVITAKYPALMGAAYSLNSEYEAIGITSYR